MEQNNNKRRKFRENIYGCYIRGTGEVEGNIINIYGSPDLSNASIHAARGGYLSENTIRIYTQGITAKDIGGFENLEFHLQEGSKPVNGTDKNPILTLTNPTSNISSNIIVYNDGAINLQNTDKITLITTDKTSGLNISDVTLADGVLLEYTTNIRSIPFSSDNPNIQSLEITVGDINICESVIA